MIFPAHLYGFKFIKKAKGSGYALDNLRNWFSGALYQKLIFEFPRRIAAWKKISKAERTHLALK